MKPFRKFLTLVWVFPDKRSVVFLDSNPEIGEVDENVVALLWLDPKA